MFDEIDKLRRENGWKPRRRGSKTASGGGGGGSATAAVAGAVSSGTTAGSGNSKNSGGGSSLSILSGLSGLEGLHSSQQKSLAETLLQKLQTEMQLRPDQQESFRLQQEALRYVLKKRWKKEAAAGLSFSHTHSKPIWPFKKPVLFFDPLLVSEISNIQFY